MQRRAETSEYKQLARVAGSSDNEAIKAVFIESVARGMSPDQLAIAKLGSGPIKSVVEA